MPSLKDYFDGVTYKPKYTLGDRVRGFWNGVPFAGSVAVDTLLDFDVGPYVVVTLDLPINYGGVWHTLIKVTHGDLINIEGKYELSSKTNSKKSKMDRN